MSAAGGSDRLPDESEIFDVPDAEPPSPEVVAELARAGLSNAGIDAIAGAGTARRLRRDEARASRRALSQSRRARRVRRAFVAAIVFALAGLVVAVVVGSIPGVIGAAAVSLWVVLRAFRGDAAVVRTESEEAVHKDLPKDGDP